MASARVVEPLDVIEHVGPGLVPSAIHFAGGAFGFSDEKKLYIAALSHTLPDRLMLQRTPWSASSV